MFGFDRIIDGLNANAKPITRQDLSDETLVYVKYAANFNREHAANPRLSYVVTPVGETSNLANLDRWYVRDAGEQIGEFILYRVKLKDEEPVCLSGDRFLDVTGKVRDVWVRRVRPAPPGERRPRRLSRSNTWKGPGDEPVSFGPMPL